MKQRCNNSSVRNYYRYGGRGISYPKNWETFEGFCEDMLSSYKLGLSLDRRDNDKSYSKGNCHWATAKEQSNNTRRNRVFTIRGITKTFSQWIEETGVKSSTARQRFYVYGWPIEEAISRKNIGK